MIELITDTNRARHIALLAAMHRDRKIIFVDRMKWNLRCDGEHERDEFDHDSAEYLVSTDGRSAEHFGSVRLLPTLDHHILGSMFADLCEDTVPAGPDIREITRLCLSPSLSSRDRRSVFLEITTALAEHALATGITSYTAVTDMRWLGQTLAVGWRCMPLGLPRVIDGSMTCAMQIFIRPDTLDLMRAAGTHRPTDCGAAETPFQHAA